MANRTDPMRLLVYVIIGIVGLSILFGFIAWSTGGPSGSSDWPNSMMSGGAWIWMPLMMLVPILLVVLLVYALNPNMHHHGHHENSEDILERRYARGDISRDEYLRMKDDLAGGRRL